MKRIDVRTERNYSVLVDTPYLQALAPHLKKRERVAVIFSESMKSSIPQIVAQDAEVFYFGIPDSEKGKSSETLLKVWDWLGSAGFTRSDLIVAIGGGAVTDFAGFAASSWLRGLDWVAVPTTVAGMVDAAVGGKTGINSDFGKNLIGAFHSPIEVIIDPQWLTTLGDRDFAAGLAEVVKCGFIRDPQILALIEGKSISDIRTSRDLTVELIHRAISVKADVVSSDFKESFEREILNYGHTFGHAVELASKYSLRHGECVSIGMVFVAHLAHSLGLLSQEIVDQHIQILSKLGLPVRYAEGDWLNLLATMRVDKKSRGKQIRFVVISKIAETKRVETVTDDQLLAAYEMVSQ
jgi:3-dehydroquinate synthase